MYILTMLASSCVTDGVKSPLNKGSSSPKTTLEVSHKVSIDDAEKHLIEILDDLNTRALRSGADAPQRKIVSRYSTGRTSSMRTSEGEEPYVHIFNFEGNNGYAIMSSDDRVSPLLALTFNGSLTPNVAVENPGMIVFLANMEEHYKREVEAQNELIEKFKALGLQIEFGPWKTWGYGMIGGSCKVQWGQDFPYNMYCPTKNGTKTITGCVATAVAQLMSVYEYPKSYQGYSFDWSEMNKHINNNRPYPAAYSQIARLMQQLGSKNNLNMDYGLASDGGSGANPKNIPRTLKNFGFSNGGKLRSYDTGTVVGDLQYGHHVLIGGFEYRTLHKDKFLGITIRKHYTYSNGHRWLAHGLLERKRTMYIYDKNHSLISKTSQSLWYPLCNFGWDGDGDGYYLSGAFDESSGPAYDWEGPFLRSITNSETGLSEGTPSNFQYNVTAVTGIRK